MPFRVRRSVRCDDLSAGVSEVRLGGESKLGATKRCDRAISEYNYASPIDPRVQEGKYDDPKPIQ